VESWKTFILSTGSKKSNETPERKREREERETEKGDDHTRMSQKRAGRKEGGEMPGGVRNPRNCHSVDRVVVCVCQKFTCHFSVILSNSPPLYIKEGRIFF